MCIKHAAREWKRCQETLPNPSGCTLDDDVTAYLSFNQVPAAGQAAMPVSVGGSQIVMDTASMFADGVGCVPDGMIVEALMYDGTNYQWTVIGAASDQTTPNSLTLDLTHSMVPNQSRFSTVTLVFLWTIQGEVVGVDALQGDLEETGVAGDFNRDSSADFGDIIAHIDAMAVGAQRADVNGDNVVDADDIIELLDDISGGQ